MFKVRDEILLSLSQKLTGFFFSFSFFLFFIFGVRHTFGWQVCSENSDILAEIQHPIV